MKSYLSLIPISAKVRKRQNRMTVLCIIISVFLVTAIFSVADMMIRTESDFMISNHGNWHIAIKNISQNNANEISNRSDVTAVGVASQFNFEGEQPYRVNEKRTVLYGTDEVYITQISNGIVEGTFPANDEEVMLTPNSVTALGVQLGDSVTLHTPAGDRTFTISGFGTDDESYYSNQTYLIGSYLTQSAFTSVMAQNGVTNNGLIGIQLDSNATEEMIAEIRSLENDDIIITDQREGNRQNNATYWAARIVCYGFLAIIGVISLFNIVNSISMSVSARIKQYGAMRAVGMDNRQLKRMISAEAYTYAISGLMVGCGIGLPLSRFLYNRLITHYFGIEWRFPILWFGIVVAFIFISAIVSVYAPAKRIRNMPITATINEL